MKLIFGKKPVIEFLKSYKANPTLYKISKIYLKNNFSNQFINEIDKLNLANLIEYKTNEELNNIVSSNHQGIIIFYEDKKIPKIKLKNGIYRPTQNLSIKEILVNYPGIYILTDRIQDPQNLGSIIRAGEALGAMGIFITGKGAKVNHTVQKVATSSLLYFPYYELSNAMNLIKEAKKKNYYILATTTKKSSKTILLKEINKIPKINRYILLLGSEKEGLKKILLEHSDYWLEIPLLGKTESLNVNQALCIALYELVQYIYF